ncbi:MAG: nucleotidyltransferase domain-containing protein [Leptolyngbyaceae bacterium]|nr:nucleotidyltransferase domain-containing protein [Leptolyngbyaceae bacterium]
MSRAIAPNSELLEPELLEPELLEQRRQEALAFSDRCIQVLKQDFGATEVIVFGSLRGDSPWHWRSDLDLAVRGMTDDGIWNAYSALEKISPPWLKVDLVPVDKAPALVRCRILQEQPMPKNKYLALKVRIEDELVSMTSTLETMNQVLAQANTVAEIIITPALASYIADFYTFCERISERVAVTLDGGLPKGDNWHELLLRQVADLGGDDRPPLWSGSLLLELDEYRKFRHLERHNYRIDLDPDRVLELAQKVEPVFEKVKRAIATFSQWLEAQANP